MTISLPTRQKTGDRQIELVQAAVALAAQHSPAEITTSDLAKTIGITQGAVFRHFESKEAIWLAVVDWAHQALLNKLRRAAQAQEVDAVQALHDVFIAHIEFVKEYPGVPRLIFQELQHAKSTPLKDKARVLMADYRALVVGLLVQADTHGQLNPGLNRLGARYNRTAFPDAFVDRMGASKADVRLAKLIEPKGNLISFVYFILDDGEMREREKGDPYELSMVLVYRPGDDPDDAADQADTLADEIFAACKKRLPGTEDEPNPDIILT